MEVQKHFSGGVKRQAFQVLLLLLLVCVAVSTCSDVSPGNSDGPNNLDSSNSDSDSECESYEYAPEICALFTDSLPSEMLSCETNDECASLFVHWIYGCTHVGVPGPVRKEYCDELRRLAEEEMMNYDPICVLLRPPPPCCGFYGVICEDGICVGKMNYDPDPSWGPPADPCPE